MAYNNYEEDGGLGLGTAATALAGLGLAMPIAKPIRKKARDLYEHFESPFARQLGAAGNELGKIGSVLRGDIARGTGQLSELGARAYNAGPAFRAAKETPYANTGEFSRKATAQNWSDTIGGAKDIARAIAAMASATPSAIRSARGGGKLGGKGTSPEAWAKFLNSRASKGFSEEELKVIQSFGAEDPFSAALAFMHMQAKNA